MTSPARLLVGKGRPEDLGSRWSEVIQQQQTLTPSRQGSTAYSFDHV
jgi:hypothetical protein